MSEVYTNIWAIESPVSLAGLLAQAMRPASAMVGPAARRLDFERLRPTPHQHIAAGTAAAWRAEHWGCAWGSFAADKPVVDKDKAEVKFLTLDAAAEALVHGLSERHPAATFRLWAIGKRCRSALEVAYRNGQLISASRDDGQRLY